MLVPRSIDLLAPFLNLASEDDFVLVVAWLLAALHAGGPYPVLAIAGEGIRVSEDCPLEAPPAVIDPSAAPVRTLPRDERELFIAPSNAHVLAFDILSGLSPWLSDTLCRLASGGAFSTRRLFTDKDEMLFAAARPFIVLGIEDSITRPDSRPRYPADARTDCRTATPAGGDGASSSSHGRTSLAHCSKRPRMAYTCCSRYASSGCRAWLTSRWATACETEFHPEGAFNAAYSRPAPARKPPRARS